MPATTGQKKYLLFGGEKGWEASDWTASDDRVRGGKSQSYLECTDRIGRFHGTLDIKTLGGAGFASQRTSGEDREWDLSDFKGIEIHAAKGDKKRYTFNLKDELLPPDAESGREQSSISYECDFELPPQTKPGHTYERTVFIPWSAFNATYRGRLKKDAKPINLKKVKRMSIMMRSFFGSQEGEFSLSMESIAAVSETPSMKSPSSTICYDLLEKGQAETANPTNGNARGLHGSERQKVAYYLLGSIVLIALYMFSGKLIRLCR